MRNEITDCLTLKTVENEKLREIDLYFKDIKNCNPLTREQERELGFRIQNGDMAARDELVRANLKFVVNYVKRYRSCGIPFSDLITEGNIGLVRAAEKFDPTKDVKFISYAVWWVRNGIKECIEKHQNGEEDSYGDLYDLDENTYEIYANSLDNDFEEEMEKAENMNSAIDDMLSILSKREADILKLYFGIKGEDNLTLGEIGKKMSMSSERVRQILNRSIDKIRVNALDNGKLDAFRELY